MSTLTTSLDDLGNVIERGLRHDLKLLIKDKLQHSIEDLLEELAIEIAENIVVRAESMAARPGDPFGPSAQVVVNFNLKDPPMVYDSLTKELKKREILKK